MTQFDVALSAAFALPIDQRLKLIDELASSVPDDQPPALSPEWRAEIDRRSAAIDAGTEKLIPWEDVRKKIYQKFGIDRAD